MAEKVLHSDCEEEEKEERKKKKTSVGVKKGLLPCSSAPSIGCTQVLRVAL